MHRAAEALVTVILTSQVHAKSKRRRRRKFYVDVFVAFVDQLRRTF